MSGKVTIVDDTFRENAVIMVTPQMRLEAAKIGKHIPKEVTFFPAVDRQRRQVQNEVHVNFTYEGKHLENAVHRAKRWMRSKRYRVGGGVPRHIARAMAVFHKVDPEGFQNAMA